MMLLSQIKYWVFGTVGVGGVYLVLLSGSGSQTFSIGATAIAACIGAMILGGVWDGTKNAEKAATYKKLARDEAARQEWLKVQSDGAKQLEAPDND
jgi:hypothetical protein